MSLKASNENENNDNHIKFGCYIYQDGLRYKNILHIISECERLDYDSIWIKDNYIPWIQDYPASRSINNDTYDINYSTIESPQNENQNQLKRKHQEIHESRIMLECWTMLSSLVPLTRRIKIGAVLVNLYRNPAIVAKMASTLDNIS